MLKLLFHNLIRSEEGSVLPLVGVAMFVLLGGTGLAVDVGRMELARSKLQSSLDSAGLAVGAAVNSVNINDEMKKYMEANFDGQEINAKIIRQTVELTPDNKLVRVNATAELPTTFMSLFGFDKVQIAASSEVTREMKGMELALVLDVTGSMAGQKLVDLKNASKDLINIVFGNQDTATNLWVGIVPFSQTVNIGTSRSSWLASNSFNWGPTSWGGCVDARYSSARDITDDPPASEKLPAYYWADNNDYNDWIRSNGQYNTPLNSTRGPNKYCPTAITTLTNQRQPLLTAVTALTAQGNTLINFGSVWGWRLLSPRWRGLWGGAMNTNNLPLNYNTDLMMKSIVIMTDGDNTMDNTADGAYGYLRDNRLGTTSQSTAESRLDTKLSNVCTAMKSKGILVYTVLFNNNNSTTATLLRNCASNPDYFFNTSDGIDLQKAFRKIGDSLANLRVSR